MNSRSIVTGFRCLLLIVGIAHHAHAQGNSTNTTAATPTAAPSGSGSSGSGSSGSGSSSSATLGPYQFDTELSSLQGNYTIRARTHDNSRPTWASVWPVYKHEQQFGIYFWPPKYCHAIYICPVQGDLFNGRVPFNDFQCDKQYIKYYPHTGKFLFKDKGGNEVEHLLMSNHIQFRKNNDRMQYTTKVLKDRPDRYFEWRAGAREELNWDLMEENPQASPSGSANPPAEPKYLLILTNSRMCEVNKPGASFHPVFDSEFDQSSSSWPAWLTHPTVDASGNTSPNTLIPTDFLPPTGEGTKTVDVLAYLKDMTVHTGGLGKIEHKCSTFEKISVAGVRKPVFERSSHVSVVSYDILDGSGNTYTNGHTIRMQFTLAGCQWIRFWVSDLPISNYTSMIPEETLDLFIQGGFVITPDSDQAKELPDKFIMNKVKLEVHRQRDPNGVEILELNELAYGGRGNGYLFRQFFKSKSFAANNKKIHIIRSPQCETNIVPDNAYQAETGKFDLANRRTATKCAYSYFL